MKFEIEEFNRNIDDLDLLEDLKSVNNKLNTQGHKITFRKYNELGKYASQTISARFGSWNSALNKAGISITDLKNIPVVDLFSNLENVWRSKGKQPTTRDMKSSLSKYSDSAYLSRFGSWRKSLEAFMDYIDGEEDLDASNFEVASPNNLTPRNINLRLRFKVLARDLFTCQSCGASPAKNPNVDLHVDHIIPWSKGGPTEESNLQTKCSACNLGKGNDFEV